MNNEQLKTLLDHQTQILLNTIISLEYLVQFPEYLKKINNDKPKDLLFIYNVIRNNTVISITQLFHGREHYSFNQVRKLLLENFSKDDDEIKKFNTTLKPGNKLFNELNILDIRNQHVGHLQATRIKHSLNWDKVSELTKIGCDTHDHTNRIVFGQDNYWEYERKLLHQIFSKDLTTRELYSTWRKMYDDDQETINRERVGQLTKINWP